MIRAALVGKNSPTEDIEINEWISSWADRLCTNTPDQSGVLQANLNQSGSVQISANSSGLIGIDPDQSRAIQISLDQSKHVQTEANQSGQIQINQDQSEVVSPHPDIPLLLQAVGKLQSQIADLTTQPPDLIAQLNAALTQFYKFSYALAERLDRLESELGQEPMPSIELDLETLQISAVVSYAHADLDFVRNSISNGKPDKDAVRQWVLNARQNNPDQSYAVLADILNQVSVPTLSGRDTWNRGTLRNLIADR